MVPRLCTISSLDAQRSGRSVVVHATSPLFSLILSRGTSTESRRRCRSEVVLVDFFQFRSCTASRLCSLSPLLMLLLYVAMTMRRIVEIFSYSDSDCVLLLGMGEDELDTRGREVEEIVDVLVRCCGWLGGRSLCTHCQRVPRTGIELDIRTG